MTNRKTLTDLIEEYANALSYSEYQDDQGWGKEPERARRTLARKRDALNSELIALSHRPVSPPSTSTS